MILALIALGLPCLLLLGFAIETFLNLRRIARNNRDILPLKK